MSSGSLFHLVFDSSSDESEDNLESDSSSSSIIFQFPKSNTQDELSSNAKPIHNQISRLRKNSQLRPTESCFVRTIPKMDEISQMPQRPQTSDIVKTNPDKSFNEINLINEPSSSQEHYYIIEQVKNKSLFGSSPKRFKLIDNQTVVFDLTINSKDKEILLPYQQKLIRNSGKTQFVMKSNDKCPTDVFTVKFKPPLDGDDCARREVIRFCHKTNNYTPSTIVSLGKFDENATNGHFYRKSKLNAAFVAPNKKTPLFSILAISKNQLEIITNLNLSNDVIFALGIASFLGTHKFAANISTECHRLKLGSSILKYQV